MKLSDKLFSLLAIRLSNVPESVQQELLQCAVDVSEHEHQKDFLEDRVEVLRFTEKEQQREIERLNIKIAEDLEQIISASSRICNYNPIKNKPGFHGSCVAVYEFNQHLIKHARYSCRYINDLGDYEYSQGSGMRVVQPFKQNNYIIIVSGLGKEEYYAAKISTVFKTDWQTFLLEYLLCHEVPRLRSYIKDKRVSCTLENMFSKRAQAPV
jgi:hypothetical protein